MPRERTCGGKANLARENNFGSDRMGERSAEPSKVYFGTVGKCEIAFYIRTAGRRL
jgi:hypothetical protein